MKSPSRNEHKDESMQSVNDALDNSVNNLSENTLSDIARVRMLALNQSKTQARSKKSLFELGLTWLAISKVNIGISVAAATAVIIAISVSYVSYQTIPELPLVMMATDVPNEDFAMLEDLEFVTWLAENEQSTLL